MVCARHVSSYAFEAFPVIYHNKDSQPGPTPPLSVREGVLYMADLTRNGKWGSRYPRELMIVWQGIANIPQTLPILTMSDQ